LLKPKEHWQNIERAKEGMRVVERAEREISQENVLWTYI